MSQVGVWLCVVVAIDGSSCLDVVFQNNNMPLPTINGRLKQCAVVLESMKIDSVSEKTQEDPAPRKSARSRVKPKKYSEFLDNSPACRKRGVAADSSDEVSSSADEETVCSQKPSGMCVLFLYLSSFFIDKINVGDFSHHHLITINLQHKTSCGKSFCHYGNSTTSLFIDSSACTHVQWSNYRNL